MIQLIEKLLEVVAKNYKVALASMLTTLALIGAILTMLNVNPVTLVKLIIEGQETSEIVAGELKEINKKIDRAELESHQNQQKMLSIVQKNEGSPDFKVMLNLSSENQDIIRAQLEFGRIYATLVETRTGTEEVHNHLGDLYQALLEVTLDNPYDKTLPFNSERHRALAQSRNTSLCKLNWGTLPQPHICRAKMLLTGVLKNISDFPDSVRKNVQIELYRYLSYCSARAMEINKQQTYTRLAANILKEKGSIEQDDPKLYRRQYYWIDYSQMLSTVTRGGNNYQDEANRYFERLQKGLVSNDDFLKLKLVQHMGMIPEERQEFWKRLVRRASAGLGNPQVSMQVDSL